VIHPFQEDWIMPAPLSVGVRRRFQRLIEDSFSGRAAARRLLISAATGVHLAAKVRRGASLAPRKCGRPPSRGRLGSNRDFLREFVEQDPDITLFELRDALADAADVDVHHWANARALLQLGFPSAI
jgi:transposase